VELEAPAAPNVALLVACVGSVLVVFCLVLVMATACSPSIHYQLSP